MNAGTAGLKANVKLTLDAHKAMLSTDALKAQVHDLAKAAADVRFRANDKQAEAALLRLRAQVESLRKSADNVNLGSHGRDRLRARIIAAELQLDQLKAKADSVDIGGRLGRAAGSLGGLAGAGGLFAAGSAALAVAAPLAAGATAMAAFGAVAVPELQKVHAATTANKQAQVTYNTAITAARDTYARQIAAAQQQLATAKTAQQRQAALNREHQAALTLAQAEAKASDARSRSTVKLTGAEQQLAGQVAKLGTMWHQLEAAMAPVVVAVASLVVKIGTDLMPLMGPLVTAGAKIVTAFLQPLDNLIRSVDFDVIIGAFTQFGVQVAKLSGPALAQLLKSLLTLFVKLMPAGVKILGVLLPLLITMVNDLAPVITAVANITAASLAWLQNNHLLIPVIAALGAAILIATVAIEGASAPVWLLVAAVAAVVVGVVELAKHWGTIWAAVQKIAGDAWNWLWRNAFSKIANFFTKTIPLAADVMKNEIAIAWDHVELIFLGGVRYILNLMGKLPGPLGAPFRAAAKDIGNSMAGVQQDIARRTAQIQADVDRLHGKSIPVHVIAEAHGSGSISITGSGWASGQGNIRFHAAAGGLVAMGTGPTSDDVPAMLSRGELVVPAGMVRSGAVDHLRGRLPGFASGGLVSGIQAGVDAIGGPAGRLAGADAGRAVRAGVAEAVAAAKRAVEARAAQAAATAQAGLGNLPLGTGPHSGSAAVAQAFARSILWAYGWGMNQFPPLQALWNQESGWSAYAVNPSSGAYGIPQSLGHGHPYNLGDYQAQIRWGLAYIKAAYGSPAAAEGHELAFHWYARGGLVDPMAGAARQIAASSALRARLARDQGHEAYDYAGLRHAFLGGPRRYLTGATGSQLAELAKRQAAETLAYRRVSGAGGLTPGDLESLGTAARSESRGAAGSALTRLPGGHPGWSRGLRAWLGMLAGESGAKLPPALTGIAALFESTRGHGTFTVSAGDGTDREWAYGMGLTGKLVPSADTGTILTPGLNLRWNGTGGNEHLVPAGQQPVTVVLEIKGSGSAEFDTFMLNWLRRSSRVYGGGDVQRAFSNRHEPKGW